MLVSKGVYQGCILGKHPEHKFERASHERTSVPLELIHSEISGPFPHISMSQSKYALTFIDFFSRYCWFTSWNTSLKFLASSKSLRLWLKTSLGGNSRSSDLTMVVSMSSLSLFNIVQMQVFRCSILSLTHHSGMVLLRGRIDHWKRWQPTWWRLRICHQCFRPRL